MLHVHWGLEGSAHWTQGLRLLEQSPFWTLTVHMAEEKAFQSFPLATEIITRWPELDTVLINHKRTNECSPTVCPEGKESWITVKITNYSNNQQNWRHRAYAFPTLIYTPKLNSKVATPICIPTVRLWAYISPHVLLNTCYYHGIFVCLFSSPGRKWCQYNLYFFLIASGVKHLFICIGHLYFLFYNLHVHVFDHFSVKLF